MEMKRLKVERKQTKRLNRKQLVKVSALNDVRHMRKKRTKENRARARVAVQVLNLKFQ